LEKKKKKRVLKGPFVPEFASLMPVMKIYIWIASASAKNISGL
jgi:hypothetical protein